jgi:uroporphyrinogen III methyltransferase/synthase
VTTPPGAASPARPVGTRPLAGRRILVTRPVGQAGRLRALLEAAGAEVLSLPAIRIEPPEDWGPLDAALARLERFRWLVFTSANGVLFVLDRLRAGGGGPGDLRRTRLAAIGPQTADTLRRAGLETEVVPGEYRAEGLVEALRARVRPGDAVLLARAAEARDVLPRELAALGAEVTVVPAYRTVLAREGAEELRALLGAGGIDAVTFTSSSTVRGLVALLGAAEAPRLLRGVVLAAIGPVTAETLRAAGLEPTLVSSEYTIPALARALAAHFAAGRPGGA